MYLCWSYFLMIMSMFMFVESMNLYKMKLDYMIEWLFCSFNSFMLEVYMFIDWVSCLFISVVMFISSMVLLYSISYMKGDKYMSRFLYLVIFFVISMFLMVLSPNLISILFGWDMLGLVSYCLVIYYNNYSSYNSGMITILANRVGDVGLLIALGITIMNGSWNMFLLSGDYVLVMLMMMLASITKSAQIPFSFWLPLAMAAPTPVSSLVHSSTLVTAGVYLIMRFSDMIFKDLNLSFILLMLSIITMFMSGLMANYEFDMKKIIALSTLSQLGVMMMILSLGFSLLSFYHLLTHAIFKSLLFLCTGMIIHSSSNNQDIRRCGNLSSMMPYISMSFFISSMALMGLPFMAGFYSKDLIFEMIYFLEINLITMVMIMISLIFTVSYSLRLCYYLYFSNMKFQTLFMVQNNMLMSVSIIFLVLLSVVYGSGLMWMFFFDLSLILMDEVLKKMIFLMLLYGIFMSVVSIYLSFFINKYYNLFSSSMWFLDMVYKMLFKNFVEVSGEVYKIDHEWVEGIEVQFFMKIKFTMMKVFFYKYKMYNIIYSSILILIMSVVLFIF